MSTGRVTIDAAQGSAASRADAGLRGGAWKLAGGLLMFFVIYGAFLIVHGAVGFGRGGNPARIVFFHVPVAILSYASYVYAAWHAGAVLARRDAAERDIRSAAGMELGFVFCFLATVSGSIFAGVQWNSFWNWDPRETSIVVMLLLYGAYIGLRSAVTDSADKRARLCAAYTLLALVPATFLIWVVPRIPGLSVHPTNTLVNRDSLSSSYRLVLYSAFLAFAFIYAWMLDLRQRVARIVLKTGSLM